MTDTVDLLILSNLQPVIRLLEIKFPIELCSVMRQPELKLPS